jgi:predicted transcriptional regulator
MQRTADAFSDLSRRERQIMDAVYELGPATAAEILEKLPSPPSYSAVRAMLKILEDKGFLKHAERGATYVFSPTVPRTQAKRFALRRLIDTFYEGSAEQVIAALLAAPDSRLTHEDLDRLEQLVQQAKKEGR